MGYWWLCCFHPLGRGLPLPLPPLPGLGPVRDWVAAQVGAMLATFSHKGGGEMGDATLFFVALVFSFDFFAPRSDGVPHFGPPSGLDFGGFWSNFGSMLGPSWRYLGALGHKRWHWMGWWGFAKRKEFFSPFPSGATPKHTRNIPRTSSEHLDQLQDISSSTPDRSQTNPRTTDLGF